MAAIFLRPSCFPLAVLALVDVWMNQLGVLRPNLNVGSWETGSLGSEQDSCPSLLMQARCCRGCCSGCCSECWHARWCGGCCWCLSDDAVFRLLVRVLLKSPTLFADVVLIPFVSQKLAIQVSLGDPNKMKVYSLRCLSTPTQNGYSKRHSPLLPRCLHKHRT